jgi:hypothetical protein
MSDDSSSMASAAEELSRERDRVVQRLRSMAVDAVPADLVQAAGQQLADLTARADGDPVRAVPRLAPYAAGDQILVLVAQLTVAADEIDPVAATALLDEARDVLTGVRRGLTGNQV